MEFHHVSILLQPCLDALNIKPDGVYVDATTGGAGHSLRIASALGEGGRLICIDRDDEALENAKTRLAPVWARVTTVKSDFRDIDRVLEGQGLAGADGILFDLGVSSPQLDHAERGFSYMKDAPLDMRMDRQQKLTAYDVVNTWSREDIRHILFEYGEERYAPLIAAATFHSLEDRIVKAAFQKAAQGCTCPKDFPVCVCGNKPKVRLTPRKPILPSKEEIEVNPRARSAKLRVCEKI